MKFKKAFQRSVYLLISVTIGFTSCKKENSASNTTVSETTTSSTIAVAASSSTDATTASTDSVYLVQPCARGSKRDSIAEANLPSGTTTYLTTNYAGYTFRQAYAIKNSSGSVTGYVVVIYYNDKPVGLEFDSSGNFVKVLEQREKGDLQGPGWHHGGRFEGRNGMGKDTVALTSIPSAILSYMSSNFSSDTLVKAVKNRDSSYVIFSVNNGLFATTFDASGNFLKRIDLPSKAGKVVGIAQSGLPANALTYLTNTYPNYVFEKAFVLTISSTDKRYVVIIDANNTKYAVGFDASGNFIAVKAIY